MTGGERRKPDRHEWEEAIHLGRMLCEGDGCDGVDLSDVETVNEAIQKWNDHIQEVHTNADQGASP